LIVTQHCYLKIRGSNSRSCWWRSRPGLSNFGLHRPANPGTSTEKRSCKNRTEFTKIIEQFIRGSECYIALGRQTDRPRLNQVAERQSRRGVPSLDRPPHGLLHGSPRRQTPIRNHSFLAPLLLFTSFTTRTRHLKFFCLKTFLPKFGVLHFDVN